MTVRLHIERLVLEGLDLEPADGGRLERAIIQDLSARFAAGDGADWSGFAVPTLPPLDIATAPREGARGLGRQVAAALHRGLKP